nr:MAG TPA: hypothetical protein [Caudoviricetes sp.]
MSRPPSKNRPQSVPVCVLGNGEAQQVRALV